MIANYNLLTLGIKSFAILDNEKKVFQRMQDQVEIENSFKYYRRSVSCFCFIKCILTFSHDRKAMPK